MATYSLGILSRAAEPPSTTLAMVATWLLSGLVQTPYYISFSACNGTSTDWCTFLSGTVGCDWTLKFVRAFYLVM